MDGHVASLLALATHGTAWLRGPGDVIPPDLVTTNRAFAHARRMRFAGSSRRRADSLGAPFEYPAWLQEQRRLGVTRLLLHTGPPPGELPAHLAAAFAGGSSWIIVSKGRWRSEMWAPARLTVTGAQGARQASYPGLASAALAARTPRSPSVTEATRELSVSLVAARDFAALHGHTSWAEWFDEALTATPEEWVTTTLLPRPYPGDATHLLAKASKAWVFGGMGSWNDLIFEGEDSVEYARVSAELYSAVCRAVVAAANAPLH